VVFGFQADRLIVWLDVVSPSDIDRARAGVLCRLHADAMVVPRGWTLDDRREPTPRLFRSTEPESTGEIPRPTRPRRRHNDADADESGPMPTLFDSAEPVVASPPVASEGLDAEVADAAHADADAEAADASVATPWRPVFDGSDDLDGLLAAESPLLSRAFQGRRPARRVPPEDR
jgi:hypothetical protein